MNNNKVKSYLGFAIKAGAVVFGSDNLFVSKKLINLVLICSTQNEKVTNKVIRYCQDNNIKYIKLVDIILGDICTRPNCKVLGIIDKSLSNAIMNEFQMEN